MANTATIKPAAKAETPAPAAQVAANGATTTTGKPAEKQPPMLEPATPAPFTDPEQFREAIQPAAPISERLERLEFLNSLCTHRDEVIKALDKLHHFYQSPQGGQQIIFRDADGETTATHHPIVIEAMVEVATAKLKAKLREVEMQILI